MAKPMEPKFGTQDELAGIPVKTGNAAMFEALQPTLRRLQMARERQKKTLDDTENQIAQIMSLIDA